MGKKASGNNSVIEGIPEDSARIPDAPSQTSIQLMVYKSAASKKIVFDGEHSNWKPSHSFDVLNSELTDQGYITTESTTTIDAINLSNYDILVIASPQEGTSFSSQELSEIQNFVSNGGSLLLIGEMEGYWLDLPALNDVANIFGVTFVHPDYSGIISFVSHEIANNVSHAEIYSGAEITGSLTTVGTVNQKIALGVKEFGSGRVVFFADCNAFASYLYEYDHLQLATNIFSWLSQTDSNASIYPDPQKSTVSPGEEIVIDIKVAEVTDLFGLSFVLTYDNKDMIEPVSAVNGGFLGNDIVFFPNINESKDEVAVGMSRKSTQGGVAGNGTVVSITLKVADNAAVGTTVTLSINTVIANNPSGGDIGFNVLTGAFQIEKTISYESIYPDPQKSTVSPGDEIVIDIKVAEVTDLFGLSFVLTYDNKDMIEPVSAINGGFLGNDIVFFPNIIKEKDEVAVGMSRKSTQGGVAGNGTVVSITLKVADNARDGTTVTLSINTVIANDPSGGDIGFNVLTGAFQIIASEPEISLSTGSLWLGDADVGTNITGTFVISNVGNGMLTVREITSDSTAFTVNPTSATIAAGQSRTVTVTFTPKTFGQQTASITIKSDDKDEGVLVVSVGGTGRAPEIDVSTTSLMIGEVDIGSSGTGTFEISNIGNKTLTIYGITSNSGLFTVNPYSETIAANRSQTITITFTPSKVGTQSAVISIDNNDSDESLVKVDVSGDCVGSVISFKGTPVAIGDVDVGSSGTGTFMIFNNGNKALSVSSIESDNEAFTVTPSSETIAAEDSLTVTITFTPLKWGSQTATVTIKSEQQVVGTVTVEGTGLEPDISLSATTVAIGNVALGTSGSGTFFIKNEGNSLLKVTEISSDSVEVFFTDIQNVNISPGNSVMVTVTFNAATIGEQTASITIISNDPDESPLVITATGTGIAPDILVVPELVTIDNVIVDSTGTGTFVIYNIGDAELDVESITIDNDRFSLDIGSATIAHGESLLVTITFHPKEEGHYTALVTIDSNDPYEETVQVSVIGTSSHGMSPLVVEQVIIDDTGAYNQKTDKLDVILLLKNKSTEAVSNVSLTCMFDSTEVTPYYGMWDNDQDNDIDSIEPNTSTAVIVAQVQVPSSGDERTITVSEIIIDDQTYYSSFESRIVFAYAERKDEFGQGKVPYRPDVDGYSFSSNKGWSWHSFVDELYNMDNKIDICTNGLFPFFSRFSCWKKRCLGIAASSNVYFEDAAAKPVDKNTADMITTDKSITHNIMLYNVNTVWSILSSESEIIHDDMGRLVSEARGYLAEGRPFILVMKKAEDSSDIKRSVSVYKIIEDLRANEVYLVVYDGLYSDGKPRFAKISLLNNTFLYENTFNHAGIVLQQKLPYTFSICKDVL
ncbi:choice-of-anchor D domain-containing protein, partial [Candidatus Latescibacterota bacterium]